MIPKASDKLTITITQAQACRMGIVFCECGHPPNNHFTFDACPCAHCECKEYRQVLLAPPKDRFGSCERIREEGP